MSTRFHRGIPIDPNIPLNMDYAEYNIENAGESCTCTKFEVCPQCATYTDEPTC